MNNLKVGMVLKDKVSKFESRVVSSSEDGVFMFDDDKIVTWYTNEDLVRYFDLPKIQFVPKKGERYYFIESTGCSTRYLKNDTDDFDKGLFELGNCYPTEKEALEALERVKKAYKGE